MAFIARGDTSIQKVKGIWGESSPKVMNRGSREINQGDTGRQRRRGIIYDPHYEVRGMIQGFTEPHSVPASCLVQKSASWPRVFTNLAMACAMSLLHQFRVVGLSLSDFGSCSGPFILFLAFVELFQSSRQWRDNIFFEECVA